MALTEPIPVTDGESEESKEIQTKVEPGEQPEKSKGEVSSPSDDSTKALIEGWKEDREYMQGEIKRLRAEAKNPTLTGKEEDELEGLDENERVEKIIEIREKRKQAVDAAEIEAKRSEIRFEEKTNKEFAENKKAILRVAEDYECKTLKQAILIWRGLNINKASKDAEYHDQRKKGADGKPGGNAGGKPAAKPYDPKTDSKKTFGDFYREGGL